MKRYLVIIRLVTLILLIPGCGFRDGFKTSEYQGVLTKSPVGNLLNFSHPISIETKNAKHITGYPSIFFSSSLVGEGAVEIVGWDHWLNQSEQCAEVFNNDGSYEVDCGQNIGVLSVFLTYKDGNGDNQTLFTQVTIKSESNQSESDVFPEGR